MTGFLNDTTVTATETVVDDEGSVEIRKIETPNGNRAEIRCDAIDDSLRLDALAFESLTWQPSSLFEALSSDEPIGTVEERAIEAGADIAETDDRTLETRDRPVSDSGDEVQIGNEYTTVLLRQASSDGSSRLEVRSPKMGYGTWLTAAELRGLARHDSSLFSELLRTPLGPEADEH